MKATLTSLVVLWCAGFTLPALGEEPAGSAPAAEASATAEQSDKKSADKPEEFDEQSFFREFQALLSRSEFDEAEKQLREALEKHPDSPRLKSLHYVSFIYLRNAGRNEQAFEHLNTYVGDQLQTAAKAGRSAEPFANYLGLLVDQATQQGGADKAAALLDDFKTRAENVDENNESLLAAVEAQRAIHLGKTNRVEEARALIEAQVEAATKAISDTPGNADAIIRKANALKSRTRLESVVDGGDLDRAWSDLLEFLHGAAQENSGSVLVVNRFESESLGRATLLARTDPDAAEALIDRIEKFGQEKTPEATEEAAESAVRQRLLTGRTNRIAAVRVQIEKTRKMLALVGADAMYPENVDGWVNGDALTPDSLKGKVVLLDFFAVWCGPCIATFPHLRDWHDEFADKGLQIIGVTNYYKYDWDEEAGRAARQPELEPDAERAAMEQFVKHHELRHTIAYVTGRELQDFYIVNGIPHAVLIDRQGKVRLFRIGSGEQNAADIKQAIEDCLAESSPAE